MEENSPNRVYILLLVLSSHRSPGEIYSNPTRKRDFLRGVSLWSRGPISFGQISSFKGLILFRSTKNSFNLLLTRRRERSWTFSFRSLRSPRFHPTDGGGCFHSIWVFILSTLYTCIYIYIHSDIGFTSSKSIIVTGISADRALNVGRFEDRANLIFNERDE